MHPHSPHIARNFSDLNLLTHFPPPKVAVLNPVLPCVTSVSCMFCHASIITPHGFALFVHRQLLLVFSLFVRARLLTVTLTVYS